MNQIITWSLKILKSREFPSQKNSYSPKNIFDKGAEKVYNNVGFLREIGVFQELGLKNA